MADSVQVQFVQFAPIPVVMIRHTGPYDGLGPVFDQLFGWVGSQGVEVKRTIGIYWDNPDFTPAAQLRSAACVEVSPFFNLQPYPGLSLELSSIAGGSYAKTRFVGPYEKLEGVWSEFTRQIEQQYRREISDNPAFEVYVNDASETPPDQLITELFMPLA